MCAPRNVSPVRETSLAKLMGTRRPTVVVCVRRVRGGTMRTRKFRASALCASTLTAGFALFPLGASAAPEAAPAATRPARDFATYQPSAKAVRVEAKDAPTIDGD